MKRGYKRLLFFEMMLFLVLILNSFVWSILSGYKMIIFLIIWGVIFKAFFGFEKDKHRYFKDLVLEVLIFLFAFFLLYYLLGVIVGFVKVSNYYTWYGFSVFILPTIIIIILKEYLRYNMICKSEGNRLLFFITIILFVFLDITISLSVGNFVSNHSVFLFLALSLLPAIISNIVFSNLTLKTGYKPIIIYSLIMNLYSYLLPIVPNSGEYLLSIIEFLLPIILWYRIYVFYQKDSDEELERNYRHKRIVPWLVPGVIVIILVYFSSGYFKYWAIAVASGSMSPSINKGDVAIVDKIQDNYNQLEVGDVIAFYYDNVIIVHRLVNIVKDNGDYYFYTKGDANKEEDNFIVKKDKIVGVVNFKVPFIGIPTVWLNEL